MAAVWLVAWAKTPVALSPASHLIDAEWNHGSSDGEICQVIKNGVPPTMIMEAFGPRVSDADIGSAMNFLRSIAQK